MTGFLVFLIVVGLALLARGSRFGFALGGGAAAASSAATAAGVSAATAATAVLKFAANIALQYAIGALAQSLLTRSTPTSGATDSLLGLPVNNTDPGAPRVWAMGRRVRVPAQVMWQEKKTRETSPSVKGKSSGISVRHVTFDVALMLNDRLTRRLTQLIVNDGLLTWSTYNLVEIRTSAMTVAEAAGQVTLTMDSTDDPDFEQVFQVGDFFELAGFEVVSGPDPNGRYWEAVTVNAHSSTPSSMVIEPRSGQTTASLNVTAGTPFSPAQVIRIDDAFVDAASTVTVINSPPPISAPTALKIDIDPGTPPHHTPKEVFRPNDEVRLDGFSSTPAGVLNNATVSLRVTAATDTTLIINIANLGLASLSGVSMGSASAPATVEFWDNPGRAEGFLPTNFVLEDHYYRGTETQTEAPLIVAVEGAGNVSGFRGQAYQVLDTLDVTDFGGVLPPNTEAVIDPDEGFTWPQAFASVAERHGYRPAWVDTSGVNVEPFEGFYLRGPTDGARALQQLLLVKQVATQDRNGTLAFSAIDNLDQVAIQNGAVFSDFGAAVGGPPDRNKIAFGEVNDEDLPTTVGVRFQDPSSGYGENYEAFGLRHPSANGLENRQELDWQNVVLSKKDARNAAATIARRARINARSVAFTLPASYLDVLENDLLSFTDDEGETHLVRVTRRDIGANFLVRVQAVIERANITVSGSPVQSAAGSTPPTPVAPAELEAIVMDCPPVLDEWGLTPGVHIAACAKPGSTWAGCTVYYSIDSGNNWQLATTLAQQHGIGATEDVLSAGTPSEATGLSAPAETYGPSALTWDTTNSVTVEFDNVGPIALATSTEQFVAEGWNWFAVLDAQGSVLEVFGARDVTPLSATKYQFSHLLRGIRGTWQGCASDHPIGSRIVGVPLYYPQSGSFVAIPGLSTGQQLDFKFVVPGKDLATTNSVGITTTRRNVQPFALRDIVETFNATDNSLKVTVANWTRANLPPGTLGPYPLDEPLEGYRFTLYDPTGTTAVYVRVKRATGVGSNTLRDPFVEFTAAEQTAAGYTPGPSETYWVDVQQIGQYGDSPSTLQEL